MADDAPASKAWIIGNVIGPIVDSALIGAIVYLLLRCRAKSYTASSQTGSAYMGDMMQPHGVGGDVEAKPEHYDHAELQTNGNVRNSLYFHELPNAAVLEANSAHRNLPNPKVSELGSLK